MKTSKIFRSELSFGEEEEKGGKEKKRGNERTKTNHCGELFGSCCDGEVRTKSVTKIEILLSSPKTCLETGAKEREG